MDVFMIVYWLEMTYIVLVIGRDMDEGCPSYSVTHVYGSKGVASQNGNDVECCQKGDQGRPGKVGPPGSSQKVSYCFLALTH